MMDTFISRLWTFFAMKFGRCAKCMRLAVRGAASGWAGVAIVYWFSLNNVVLYLTLLLATGLTILGLLHILIFGARSVAAARQNRRSVEPAGDYDFSALAAPPLTRRTVLAVFIRSAAVAALASLAVPRLARAACGDCADGYGDGWYDCITNFCNTVGQYCCPPGFPYLNHCDCECYDSTNFDCNSYSNCLYCN